MFAQLEAGCVPNWDILKPSCVDKACSSRFIFQHFARPISFIGGEHHEVRRDGPGRE